MPTKQLDTIGIWSVLCRTAITIKTYWLEKFSSVSLSLSLSVIAFDMYFKRYPLFVQSKRK